MNTDSLYRAKSENELHDYIKATMNQKLKYLRNENCTDEMWAKSKTLFLPATCCTKYKKHDKR